MVSQLFGRIRNWILDLLGGVKNYILGAGGGGGGESC